MMLKHMRPRWGRFPHPRGLKMFDPSGVMAMSCGHFFDVWLATSATMKNAGIGNVQFMGTHICIVHCALRIVNCARPECGHGDVVWLASSATTKNAGIADVQFMGTHICIVHCELCIVTPAGSNISSRNGA
jgi:hypothetical protein